MTPRSDADRIEGWARDAEGRLELAVRVRAAPLDGEANAALERLLAQALGVPRAAVHVARGARSRTKAVEIDGVDADALGQAFGGADGA